jgi:hypothetical protein
MITIKMNYLVLSKIYKLVEIETDCEHCKVEYIKFKNYENLVKKLDEYNYDYSPEEILIDVKYDSNIEEALVSPDSLILTSDNTEIVYSETHFIIKWFCSNKAAIDVKDDKKYCLDCFEQLNKQLSFDMIKKILDTKDEMYGLSTSKKIEYILVKNLGKKLSAAQIYNIGNPWDLKTFTPRNSVYARASSLYQSGSIKRDGVLYFI